MEVVVQVLVVIDQQMITIKHFFCNIGGEVYFISKNMLYNLTILTVHT